MSKRPRDEDEDIEDGISRKSEKSEKSNFNEKRRNYEEERSPIILTLITALAYVLAVLTYPFTLCENLNNCKKYQMKKLRCDPYERVVVLRLGRKLPGELRGPGRVIVFPWIDDYWVIDLRSVTVDVPPQAVLTKDSVTVAVDAVIFYKIKDPMSAIMQVEDPIKATSLMAVATLRNEIGKRELSQVLSEREQMMDSMKKILVELTEPWGIEVERVDIKNVSLPPALQKSMAAEAEATRQTKAKIIASEGEVNRAKALLEASATLVDNPTALQLRYLQSLNEISVNKDSTLVFPFPMDFLESFESKPGAGPSSGPGAHGQ
ncbi:hypothetical protein PYW08_014583 [Mythimna loreyi]|uniref:Uncharacterized protein n=1 Tax=Mythimna loreyi TaxID=667449 RepID=A0ACC2R3A3_9NEOP|nr:hypothetical protein PYW08_014583 [Mythimna loreyi]